MVLEVPTQLFQLASSTNAIIDAFNYIRLGHADVMVTGGSEAAVTIAGMGGFNAMHALSQEMMINNCF
jgi:3-oxoacyl-[acyl-carrier-protein] synthase II